MISPATIIVTACASIALAGGALYGAYSHGITVAEGKQAARELAIAETREAAQLGAADAISKIKVKNTTVQGKVHREIQTNTVYRDCRVPADGVRLINEALTGKRPEPAGGGKLSGTDANAD